MSDPVASGDPRAFWELRQTPLHMMMPAQWRAYYPAMASWLRNADARIRECAVERLTTAVLWSEFGSGPAGNGLTEDARSRLAWLIDEVSEAHRLHHDVIPMFLQGLRHQLKHEPFKTPLLDWFDELARKSPAGVDAGLIAGTRLLVADIGDNFTARMTEWLGLLDHPSDYVRACAAYLLGNFCDEETVPDRDALFAIIGAKERVRPGVAGPFWSPRYSSGIDLDEEQTRQATAWMLDLLEQRQGIPPPLPIIPFNDIAFYLHEMCSHSPEDMWRMLRGGHKWLALMTATEMNERLDGVQPVLEALARHENAEIAVRARSHLVAYYSNT